MRASEAWNRGGIPNWDSTGGLNVYLANPCAVWSRRRGDNGERLQLRARREYNTRERADLIAFLYADARRSRRGTRTSHAENIPLRSILKLRRTPINAGHNLCHNNAVTVPNASITELTGTRRAPRNKDARSSRMQLYNAIIRYDSPARRGRRLGREGLTAIAGAARSKLRKRVIARNR